MINLSSLKTVKNAVIGNPSAKRTTAQDTQFVHSLVHCLNNPPLPDEAQGSQDDIRIEAAHVISSLSYGSPEALQSLLRAKALQAFIYAISRFTQSDPVPLKAAFARALRSLAVAIADAVGPPQWGLHLEPCDIRNDAKDALECLFQVEYLDVYLPLLVDTSLQTSTSIAQLLASAIRCPSHRRAVSDWLPRADRMKEVKGKRGWEKPDATNANAPGRMGGWVARHLTALLRSRDNKLQEASLAALAALAKDNPTVASALARSSLDRNVPPALTSVLSQCKSRSLDVQLAACLCATHIMRASIAGLLGADLSYSLPIVHALNRLIASATESAANRTKACFILFHLVTDNKELSRTALERGSAKDLAFLVTTITPAENHPDWDQEEPESICCLREAALMAIAALSLFDNETRREFTDNSPLVAAIGVALNHQHVGVRYAACQCVRALSRAVSVIRTNVVDSGIGKTVFQILKKSDEDRRVTHAALLAICNLVNEFSPLRPMFLEQGIMVRLVELLRSHDSALRLNALWAIKNLLRKTATDTKRDVMNHLGWRELSLLLVDADEGLQEQAWGVVRNLSENETGIDMVFTEFDSENLVSQLTVAIGSKNEDVLIQAVSALANLANGSPTQQTLLVSHKPLLGALRSCLGEANVKTRKPAVSFVLQLARSNPKQRKEFVDAGIVTTLKRICDWPAGAGAGGGGTGGTGGRRTSVSIGGHQLHHVEEEKEIITQARIAIDWLEHGEDGF